MSVLTPTIASPAAARTAPAPPSAAPARTAMLAGALVAGALASLALGIWHPEPDANDEFSYAIVEPIRDAWWAWHVFGGIATAIAAVAASIAVCGLVRRRGAALANVGAALTSLGGVAFAVGIGSEGVLLATLTDPDVVSADIGRPMIDYVNDNPERFLAAILPGIILLTLGTVLLGVALWRSKSVPRWVPLAVGVGAVAGFFVPFGVAGYLVNGVSTAGLIGIAWYLWRTIARPAPESPASNDIRLGQS